MSTYGEFADAKRWRIAARVIGKHTQPSSWVWWHADGRTFDVEGAEALISLLKAEHGDDVMEFQKFDGPLPIEPE